MQTPPWSYYNDKTVLPDCTTVKGMRRPPYAVMSTEDIKNLPVSKISEDECLLFIWTTDYHMKKCMDVITAWGFEYKTVGLVWQKLNKSGKPVCFMGAYTMKSGVEICLLATKGKDSHKLVKNHKVRSLIQSERQRHSKKPDEARQKIEQLVGDVEKIELFARERYNGWDAWGNEVQ
jgi:N6-adenosine-specific RNA methylase IME4